MDKAIPSQQDISRYRIGLLVLRARSNRIEDLRALVPEILRVLPGIHPGKIVRVG